jgi:hypothetical protein
MGRGCSTSIFNKVRGRSLFKLISSSYIKKAVIVAVIRKTRATIHSTRKALLKMCATKRVSLAKNAMRAGSDPCPCASRRATKHVITSITTKIKIHHWIEVDCLILFLSPSIWSRGTLTKFHPGDGKTSQYEWCQFPRSSVTITKTYTIGELKMSPNVETLLCYLFRSRNYTECYIIYVKDASMFHKSVSRSPFCHHAKIIEGAQHRALWALAETLHGRQDS